MVGVSTKEYYSRMLKLTSRIVKEDKEKTDGEGADGDADKNKANIAKKRLLNAQPIM